MKTFKIFCVSLVLLSFCNAKEILNGLVVAVSNTNTLVVVDDKKRQFITKLAYIQPAITTQEQTQNSLQFLNNIVLGKEVEIEKLAVKDGNVVGIVETKQGFNINSAIVYNGLALAYGKKYHKAQIHAKNNQLGIWSKKSKKYNLTKTVLGFSGLLF